MGNPTPPHRQRCLSSRNTSVNWTGDLSPKGVLYLRTLMPQRPQTSSSSSPLPPPSTKEFGETKTTPRRGSKNSRHFVKETVVNNIIHKDCKRIQKKKKKNYRRRKKEMPSTAKDLSQ